MTERSEPEREEEIREHEATVDDGGDVAETPDPAPDEDSITRPGPAPGGRTTAERPGSP